MLIILPMTVIIALIPLIISESVMNIAIILPISTRPDQTISTIQVMSQYHEPEFLKSIAQRIMFIKPPITEITGAIALTLSSYHECFRGKPLTKLV